MLTTLILLKHKHCAKRKNRRKGLGGALPKNPIQHATTRSLSCHDCSGSLIKSIKANVLWAKHTNHGVHVKSQQ